MSDYYSPTSPDSFLLFFMCCYGNDEFYEDGSNAEMFGNEHLEEPVQETHEEAGGQEFVRSVAVTVGVLKFIKTLVVSLPLPQVYFNNGELAI